MSITVPKEMDPNRLPKRPFRLKAKATVNRITLNPSSANPGEKLNINIPKLSENVVLVPGSIKLKFNFTETGHTNNKFVNNVSRALVRSMKVVYGGEVLQDTQRYDLIKLFEDAYLDKEVYDDLLGQGVLYMYVLKHTFKFELTLAPVSDNVDFSSNTPEATCTYKITNLELEYASIHNEYLAKEAAASYRVRIGFFYENIILHKEFTISKPNDSFINESVNIPRKSMTGILCLFTESDNDGARESEKFVNPNITSIDITIDGMPNQLYSKGMVPTDFWESIKRRYPAGVHRNVKEITF